ncbi:MAG: hypothetical protein FWB88_06480 [Defluviitaleaceae bacterium]|nr:hypothetical protein [Defluviitaleaceae bacterium]MCL2239182.1 hypothetical protein [Defluviitaleaceae bacterium]
MFRLSILCIAGYDDYAEADSTWEAIASKKEGGMTIAFWDDIDKNRAVAARFLTRLG